MPDLKLALKQLLIKHRDHSLVFSDITKNDLFALQNIYASTREAELSLTQWSEQQKSEFIEQQFVAQHTHYQTHFSNAKFLLIQQNNQNIGRLYIEECKRTICLIDITLLPPYKHQQIGSQILKWLIAYADDHKKIITLHVESHNPAHSWYLKAGFKDLDDRGVYQYMEWHPSSAAD